MGLISDYLEQCRDRSNAGDLDPCMIIGGSFRGKLSSYHEIYRTLTAYSNSSDDEQKKLLHQQLTERSSELETKWLSIGRESCFVCMESRKTAILFDVGYSNTAFDRTSQILSSYL